MKHITNLLATVGFVALILVFTGFTAPFEVVNNFIDNAEEFNDRPSAKSQIVIRGTATYTVPTGRGLVITAMGISDPPDNDESITLLIDSVIEVEIHVHPTFKLMPSIGDLAYPGYVAKAGEVVSLTTSATSGLARAWGYLVEI